MAFEVVKAMRADDLDWSEGFRPLGRQAIAEIIAQCAAHAALQSGRGGAGLCRVARKSTCATPVLLVATHCRAVRLIRGERPMTTNNPITLTASEPATGPWVECDTPAKLRLSGNGPAYCKLGRQVGYRREVPRSVPDKAQAEPKQTCGPGRIYCNLQRPVATFFAVGRKPVRISPARDRVI